MSVYINNALCPNPDCRYHTKAGLKGVRKWYEFHGYYNTKKGNIPRYKCKNCGKTFTLSLLEERIKTNNYYDCRKIWEMYRNGVSINELSVKFQIDPNKIFNDIEHYLK